jgi:alpha-ribazole phosphatase
MDFGHWEMQAWSAIPKAAIDNWTANFAHHRFGGQESAQEVIDRVSRALEHALALKEPEMVWVTHAGVMRALQFLHDSREHCTISSVSEWPAHAPAMGAWMTLEFPD